MHGHRNIKLEEKGLEANWGPIILTVRRRNYSVSCVLITKMCFLAGGQIKLHKRCQACFTVGAGCYPHKYTTIPSTRKSKTGDRPSSEAATWRRDHSQKRFPVEQLPSAQKGGPRWKTKMAPGGRFSQIEWENCWGCLPLTSYHWILDQLGRSKYFTCLDMVMSYHQIELAPWEGPKTAFSTKQGHWEYRRLPFGLKTVPATFQKLMNSLLSGLTGTRCFVYLDDIAIYARSLAGHNAKLREVLDRLRINKLKLQPDKCQFLGKEVNCLGHQITEAGLRPDPQKVAAIKQFPTPTTAKQLKTFCGMISYYRQFIPSCSRIASPLCKLLKKGANFVWTEA